MGRPKGKWLTSLEALPAMQCLASPTYYCFREAEIMSPGRLYDGILIRLNQIVNYVNGAPLYHASRHHAPSFPSWQRRKLQLAGFFV